MCCNHLQSLLPAVPLLELNRSYIFCEIFVRKNISILNPNKCKSKPLTGVKARKKSVSLKICPQDNVYNVLTYILYEFENALCLKSGMPENFKPCFNTGRQ